MDGTIIAMVVLMAVVILHNAHNRGGGMHELLAAWALKASGALAGASLAAWWRKAARRGLQIISGWWLGTVSGSWMIDFMAWPVTPDYLLMSGSIMGLVGFSLMEGILILDWKAVSARLSRVTK